MSAIRAVSAGFEKKARIGVYDWLRGLASLAVIFGHFKPFGLSKVFFVWAIHAFMMVTVVLVLQSPLSLKKMVKRLAYLAFIYLGLFLIFRPLFLLQDIQPVIPLAVFFLNPATVFIENPYFGHLWYLLIYVQLLFFLFFMTRPLEQWDRRSVLLGALIVSEIFFTLTHDIIKKYPTVFLPSWFFTMAVGLTLLPKVTAWAEENPRYRIWRCLLSFMVLGVFWSRPEIRDWLILADARVSLLSTLIYFVCIYTVIEIYFIFKQLRFFDFTIGFVSLVSRYTLALYIYHQGLGRLLLPYAVPMEIVTPLSIVSGLLAGHLLHHLFLGLERFFAGLRVKLSPEVTSLLPQQQAE